MTQPLEIHVPAAAVEKQVAIRQIHDADWRVEEQEQICRTHRAAIQSEIESMPEFDAVEKAKQILDTAKRKLEIAKDQNGDLNRMKMKLADERGELRTRRTILATLLIHYMADHKVKTIEVDGDNHEIKIQAKIGKKLKHQMELPI